MNRAANSDCVQTIGGGIAVKVLASPGASVSKVRGIHGGALKVAVRSAPENGKANAEIEEVLAEFFGVARKQTALISGETSRNKRVRIFGVDAASARAKIAALQEK